MADQPVASVSQPSIRMAPTIVRLAPQLIGRGSMSSVPRGSQACERPIARLAPDSSRNTSRRGIYRCGPGLERAPLVLDPRTIELRRPGSFFLNTYPRRWSARRMLERWTRAAGAARWLYARVNSSVVRSGRS